MGTLKEKIINAIIKREGGYVNDPSDSGGETMYGITKKVARANGYEAPMHLMPKWVAFEIYEKRYLKPIRFDDIARLSALIAEEMADTAVNMGYTRAGEFLQRSLNVLNRGGKDYEDLVVDGKVGAKTLRALKKYIKKRGKKGERVLYKMLNALQGAFYVTLAERRSKDEKFITGWFENRVA